MKPTSRPPAIPKSASPASPGPFTAQPMTATSNTSSYPSSRASTDSASRRTSTFVRPQELPRHPPLLDRVGGERDAQRVADPAGQQRADPDSALDRARERRAGLG